MQLTDAECEHRAHSIVNASPEQVAAFETAARPVVAMLEQDPLNKEVIAALHDLKAKSTASPQPGAPCAQVAVATPEAKGLWTSGPLPNGVWKADLTVDDFVRYGMPRSEAEKEWAGTLTWTIQDSKMTFAWKGLSGDTFQCQATMSVSGDQVSVVYSDAYPDCAQEVDTVQWRPDGDGLRTHTENSGGEAQTNTRRCFAANVRSV